MTLEDLWQQKSNQELEIAAKQLDDYREDVQQVILIEMHRRGMIEAATKADVALRHPPQQTTPRYARFWRRFAAFFIDGIVLRITLSLIGAAVSLSSIEFSYLGIGGIGILISWIYYAASESSPEQATLGKQAMGIFVTDLDGNRISFVRATGRYFSKLLSTTTLLIGYTLAAFTNKRQALHDLLAGTLVVEKNSL